MGHGNYRAFLQFLAYATAATCHALGLLAAHAVYALSAATASRVVRTGIQSRVGVTLMVHGSGCSCAVGGDRQPHKPHRHPVQGGCRVYISGYSMLSRRPRPAA